MTCPACAQAVADGARFCAHCGVALASSAVETVAAPPGAVAAAPRPLRPPSTDPFDQARFIPGTMVAGRYRIVALLGRGGMGEVYRAEDLKLGQAVALKFLPEKLARNADRLARFHQEVRLARQVAHPHVCRVYDVGEADGQPYLSMEYVDGEDLASLLRRIGRLPPDKTVQLAKQLCAGLAAAHDRGVLHGDLKPANVLVDGRGRIRIADFGLAGLAEAADEQRGVMAGTPGYMAPEQLAGHGTSMRTDVYALGLVLYEMCTGKPALDRDGRPRQPTTRGSVVLQPSEIIGDLDPAIERVILRCLEEDPARRPPSAVSVAAALPGGDPLAAALAAGETPSPELVAAAGETGGISRLAGALCLAAIVAGIVLVAWVSRRTTVTAYVPLNANAHVMADRARATLEALGLFDPDAGVDYRYGPDRPLLEYIRETDRSATRWDRLRSDRLTAIMFWYRLAPPPGPQTGGRVDFIPYDAATDAVSVVTDPRGRLTRLVADVTPEAGRAAVESAPEPDWAPLFEAAELDSGRFRPVAPAHTPPLFVDDRQAWEGELPDAARTPVRIEAGARAGTPVWFELVPPWAPDDPAAVERPGEAVFFGFILAVFVVSLGLARRNARMGRADRTGALRGAALVGAVQVTTIVLYAQLTAAVVGVALANVVAFWVFYMALEPYVRRFWPEILVGWRALLAGRVRDPVVGRDLLAGNVAGVLLALLGHGWLILLPSIGQPPDVVETAAGAPWGNLLLVTGGPEALAYAVGTVFEGLLLGLPLTVVLVLLAAGLGGRRRLAAAALFLVMMGVFGLPAGGDAVRLALLGAIFIGLVSRFGLLAFVTMYVPLILLGGVVIRFDAAPYATASYVVVGVVGALALYGLHTALGGRSLFGDAEARDVTVPIR